MLPWFVRDYIAATGHLSPAERGVYTDLLFASWEMGPLPKDPVRLARVARCDADLFTQIWPAIREKFSETTDGLVNTRLEEHRAESMRRSQTAREKAEKRWHKDAAASATADAPADAAACAVGYAQSMLPSPSPSPSPNPDLQSPSETLPLARTAKPAYHAKQFHDLIISTYHKALPDLPAVKVWTEKRRSALNARIRERCLDGKAADTVDYWRSLFAQVNRSDFLTGRKTDFRADLEWLLRPENFAKVIEGRYDAGSANGAAHGR